MSEELDRTEVDKTGSRQAFWNATETISSPRRPGLSELLARESQAVIERHASQLVLGSRAGPVALVSAEPRRLVVDDAP